MDEEELFARHKLIDMAECMLLRLPPVQELEYKDDEMSLMNSKITVQEKEHQQEKTFFIMGIRSLLFVLRLYLVSLIKMKNKIQFNTS